jgi:hypothetical protein
MFSPAGLFITFVRTAIKDRRWGIKKITVPSAVPSESTKSHSSNLQMSSNPKHIISSESF